MNKVKFLENFRRKQNLNVFAERFKITKPTIIFRIHILKLVDKYPKIMTSPIILNLQILH